MVNKSPHDIRRTVFTRMYYDEHMDIDIIRRFAGHTTIQQTLEYIKHDNINGIGRPNDYSGTFSGNNLWEKLRAS